MANPTSEIITMADLESQCRDRLDYARQAGEAVVRTVKTFDAAEPSLEVTTFETSTGVKITSIKNQISLKCDFSDGDYGPQRVLTIDFNTSSGAPDATEVTTTDKGTTSKTTPLKKHNVLAAKMSKFVALEI